MSEGILLVVSGPSGAGKSTLLSRLMAQRDDLYFSVSVTTRSARPGETDGEHYHFISYDDFAALRDGSALLEWAEYADRCYGTPSAPVEQKLKQGKIVILDIEMRGARQVMANRPDAVTVFLSPSSEAEVEKRLRSRGTESEEKIQKRIAHNREAYAQLDAYEYTVVNDDMDRALAELVHIIEAEKIKTCRRAELFAQYRCREEKSCPC